MVVESCVIIEKIIEDSLEQTMEFDSKNKKGKPCKMNLPFMKKRYHKCFRPLIITCS